MPHAATSDRKIKKGDLVTVDMGTYFDGYASDLTRTVVVGEPSARQQEIYDLVLTAQQKAIASARSWLPIPFRQWSWCTIRPEMAPTCLAL